MVFCYVASSLLIGFDMKLFFVFLLVSLSLYADMPRIVPPALKKGDLIAIVFPASYLDKNADVANEALQRKAKWLQSQGYRTCFYPQKVTTFGYLAGSDAERASALMNAWKDPEVKALWCFRGGYGTPRILDRLDYEWIKKHPKILLGMSDITGLHHAIQEKTGLVTFLAPVLNYFGDKESSFQQEYAFSAIEQMLVLQKPGKIKLPKGAAVKVLRPGKASGRLVGGNLTLVAALCGTPWQINTDNKVLVLEDIGEEIYRIDRMLWQLKTCGLLDRPAAVILGSWKDCTTSLTNSLTLDEVFTHYFGKANYPVLQNFPTGHDSFQTILPLNGLMNINTALMSFELPEQVVQSE